MRQQIRDLTRAVVGADPEDALGDLVLSLRNHSILYSQQSAVGSQGSDPRYAGSYLTVSLSMMFEQSVPKCPDLLLCSHVLFQHAIEQTSTLLSQERSFLVSWPLDGWFQCYNFPVIPAYTHLLLLCTMSSCIIHHQVYDFFFGNPGHLLSNLIADVR